MSLEVLLDNLSELCMVYRDNPSHKLALERFNTATGANLKLNAFRALTPAILATVAKLDNDCQTKLGQMQERLDEVIRDRNSLDVLLRQRQLDIVRQERLAESVDPPKSFNGWSAQTDKKGYIRLYRKLDGKLVCVYVGKRWSDELAREKLRAAGYGYTKIVELKPSEPEIEPTAPTPKKPGKKAKKGKIRNRGEIMRELASIAVAARKSGDKKAWEEACQEWEVRATAAEKRKAPKAITAPWSSSV